MQSISREVLSRLKSMNESSRLTCIWIMIRPVILLQGIPAKSIPWIFTTGKSDLQVGDTVLAGDPNCQRHCRRRKGQTRFVHARADIKAYTDYEIKIEVPLQQVERISTGEQSVKNI